MGDCAGIGEQSSGRFGIVGVNMHLERGRIAHHEHRVADLLERLRERPLLETAAGDGEVRAVSIGGRGVLGMSDASRSLVFERGRLAAAQCADDSSQQHRQGITPSVHHTRLDTRKHESPAIAAAPRAAVAITNAAGYPNRAATAPAVNELIPTNKS